MRLLIVFLWLHLIFTGFFKGRFSFPEFFVIYFLMCSSQKFQRGCFWSYTLVQMSLFTLNGTSFPSFDYHIYICIFLAIIFWYWRFKIVTFQVIIPALSSICQWVKGKTPFELYIRKISWTAFNRTWQGRKDIEKQRQNAKYGREQTKVNDV